MKPRIAKKDSFNSPRCQLVQARLKMWTKQIEPNSLGITEKIGLSEYRQKKRILSWSTYKGLLFIKWQAYKITSSQNYLGTCMWINKVWATSKRCLSFLSATPFCCEVCKQVVSVIYHKIRKKWEISFCVYSRALLVRKTRIQLKNKY